MTAVLVNKISQPNLKPNLGDLLEENRFDLIINIPTRASDQESKDGYIIRRMAVDLNIPLITNRQLADSFIMALSEMKPHSLKSNSLLEYRARPR